MHHTVGEEVHETLDCLIETVCEEKFNEKLSLTLNDFQFSKSNDSNKGNSNGDSDETLPEECCRYEANEKPEIRPIYSLRGLDQKHSDLNELNFSDSQTHVHFENKMEDIRGRTSSPLIPNEKEYYSKHDDESFDKTIDDAILKYETAYKENAKEVKDASVQTVFHVSGTTDKQCQCDMGFADDLRVVSHEGSPVKKIKLEISARRSANWKSETFEMQQAEGKKAKYLENGTTSQMKTSRIRVGLSKRVRPPPLHIMS